jgi:DNA-binding NarL/FixJ family response regulator
MDGVEATRRIKERWPGIKVIGLSMFDDVDGGGKMRAAGADGYVSKSGPPEELIKAIRQCARAGGTDEMSTAGSRSARRKRN